MPKPQDFTVKGTWFVVARDYVVEKYGAEASAAVGAQLSAAHAPAWSDPLPGLWYPEVALQEALAGLHQGPAQGSAADFEQICAECTRRGLNRFFSAVLAMSSPHLVLKGVPTMWRTLRKGPARIDVRRVASGTEVHYSAFPFFGDLRYRRMTIGSLGALVEGCAGRTPRVTLGDWSDDHLVATIGHDDDEQRGSRPPPR